jgi:ADP-ribose pyrophosphatase YjhB (NUDIX family)
LKGGVQTLGRRIGIEPNYSLLVAKGKAKGLAVIFDMTSQQPSERQRAEARALIEEHETKTKETYHGDVFFSDSGEVFLMSKGEDNKTVVDKPTRRVSVVAQTSDLVALSWSESQNSFWLPSTDVGPDETTDKAAERALFEQAGISIEEVPEGLENVGIFRDPDGRVTSVYSLSLDDPRHVSLCPKGRAKKDLSWARWLPIDTFIEKVRGFHTGSSGEGANHKFVPLHYSTLSVVETKFLTEYLENARAMVKKAKTFKRGAG